MKHLNISNAVVYDGLNIEIWIVCVLKKEIKVLPGHPQKTNIFCSVM
jgi:hypothetical protein